MAMSRYLVNVPKCLLFLCSSTLSMSIPQIPVNAQELYIKNASYSTDSELLKIVHREISADQFTSIRDSSAGRRMQPSSNLERLEREKYERYYEETRNFLGSKDSFDELTCQSFYTFDTWDEPSVVSISCQEFLEAAACKFSSKANLEEEAMLHCGVYSKYFDKTLAHYKGIDEYFSKGDTEVEPYQDALRHRCFFGYNVNYLDREETLGRCLDAYHDQQKELEITNRDERYSVVSSSFDLLEAISLIYLGQGKDDIALDMINSELEYLDQVDLGQGFRGSEYSEIAKAPRLQLLGDIYFRSGRYSEAVDIYHEMTSHVDKYSLETEKEYKIRNKYSLSLLKNGDFSGAEQELRAVIANQEKSGPGRLVSFNSDYLRIQEANQSSYDALQAILIREERYEEALEIADRSRSFLFSKSFQSNDLYDSETGTQKEREPLSINEIKEEAKEQNATIVFYSENNLNASEDATGREAENDERIYTWVIKPDGTVTFKDTKVSAVVDRSRLQLSELFYIERLAKLVLLASLPILVILAFRAKSKWARSLYVSGAAVGICAFAIGSTLGNESIRSVNRPEKLPLLSQAVVRTSASTRGEAIDTVFGKNICSESARCLRKMYQLLIGPIEDELPKSLEQHVIFIPDGTLHGLSFTALKSSDGKYLIDSYVIRNAPSITALRLLRLRAEKKAVVATENLVVGNPTMPQYSPVPLVTQQLEPLPNSEKEANQVAQLLDTIALVGSEATRESVVPKLTSANYIHLATHGLPHTELDASKPPAFALAPSVDFDPELVNSPSTGLLDTNELYSIPFNGELAVLSACDTSSGITTVEGNLSLARPFLINGIPTVVASLWPVRDDSTSELMVAFYKNLESTSDKAAALRDATLLIKRKYPKAPRYWAGFTMIGLSDIPTPEIAAQSQVVGKKSCFYKYSGGNLDNNAVSLTQASLSSAGSGGFSLEVVEETGRRHRLDFDSNKVIQAGNTALPGEDYGEVGWNLDSTYPYENNPIEVYPDGNFRVGLPVSRRSVCSFEGRLEFIGDSKANFF